MEGSKRWQAMRKWKQRLRDDGGASIVIALVIFLVVTLVSFAVVNAALANAQRISGQRQDEKVYLSVTSAASLLREQISGAVVTLDVGETRTVYSYSPAADDNAPLSNTIKALVKAAYEDTSGGVTEPFGKLRMQFQSNVDLEADVWLIMKDGGSRMEAIITPKQDASSPDEADMTNSVTLVFSSLSFKPVAGEREVYEVTFRDENIYARGGTEQ